MNESSNGSDPAAMQAAAEQHGTAATEAIADGNIMATSASSGVTCRRNQSFGTEAGAGDVGHYQGSAPVRHENAHVTAVDEAYAADNDARNIEQNMQFLPPQLPPQGPDIMRMMAEMHRRVHTAEMMNHNLTLQLSQTLAACDAMSRIGFGCAS